jgi:hypothetical protein
MFGLASIQTSGRDPGKSQGRLHPALNLTPLGLKAFLLQRPGFFKTLLNNLIFLIKNFQFFSRLKTLLTDGFLGRIFWGKKKPKTNLS